MTTNQRKRLALRKGETFEVFGDHLIRKVVPRRGQPYEHRCPRRSLERVAHAIDELGEAGFTIKIIAEHEDLPFTHVAVALAFLRERGIIETHYRHGYAATQVGVHLDAMTEYHALAENG